MGKPSKEKWEWTESDKRQSREYLFKDCQQHKGEISKTPWEMAVERNGKATSQVGGVEETA